MSDRYALVPTIDTAEIVLERVMDAFGKSGVSLAECLDTDAVALSAGDMRYFDQRYFGKVPTYAVFMRYLNKVPPAVRDSFMAMVAEVESANAAKTMEHISNKDSIGLEEVRRFKMASELNKAAERRIDRFDKRAATRADNDARSVDMAARLISALSNADLLKIKGRVDAIDAEYQAMEVAQSETPLPKPAEGE